MDLCMQDETDVQTKLSFLSADMTLEITLISKWYNLYKTRDDGSFEF